MKTIVGVDLGGFYRPALNLVARLAFGDQHLHMLHVGERVPLAMHLAPGVGALPVAEIEQAERESAEALLERASAEAREGGMEARTAYEMGNPAHLLMTLADAEHADLIAVGAEQKGKYGSFFMGSVGRGLAIGAHQSVLVAKGQVPPTGAVRAVLATDHSDYANRCIDRLIALEPKGLEWVTVVTATESDSPEDLARRYRQIQDGGPTEQQYQEALVAESQRVVGKLTGHGYEAHFKVVRGYPHEVIRQAMQDSQADLLILGAQGHGFMERLLIGSVSLQQVVSEPYSTLLVRA